jgi:hypothetical protein
MATEITQIDIQDFTSQTYKGSDTSLLSQFEIDTSLTSNGYIEYFIYDNNKNLLSTDYSFSEYTILNDGQSSGTNNSLSQIEIDPEKALINNGFDQGEYITYFNIFNKRIGSELQQLYITEISSDRTEIRLDSTSLTEIDIVEQTNNFVRERENSAYFLDFYLNFGDNNLFISNNISLDNLDVKNPTVLIKLYEPLPDEFDLNSTLWVVTVLEEPVAYKVTFEDTPIIFTDTVSIGGPNFNLDLKDQVNNSSLELSYADLVLTSLTSSANQLNSLLEEKEIDINVDYTDFSNFIHFSSVQSRIENFYYKVGLIEQYSSSISLIDSQIIGSTSSSLVVSSSKATYESKIDNIITNFDGYDYYLYYSSESLAYPKTNSTQPYKLSPSKSLTTLTWLGSADETSAYYGGILLSASIYDNLNQNNLFHIIPEYLREDPANDPYQLFIEMVGQHYDNIWIYYKDVTQKYNADNRLENGISKDIVADAIRDFGIKLYQNNFSNEDLYTAFLGLTPEGGLFPFPNITGSLPTPSGYEYIDTKISASNDYLPLDDVNKSLYKRIYHNLPYLLQTKGTLPGLRALITSYGIPDTILRIKEYGGKDKTNTNDWDYWQNEFNYAYKQNGDNFISSSFVLNSLWGATSNNPETVMFRFKTNGLPTSSIPYSQSLFLTKVTGTPRLSTITLRYIGPAYTSGSYSGSIVDPYYQYAYLDFHPDAISTPSLSASIYLPFFDGDWWSVMAKKTGTGVSTNFELYSGNKMYEGGENGTSIGFFDSSLVIANDTNYNLATQALFGSGSINVNFKIYNSFSGSFQEIRYYSKPISESVFKDYIMNPSSIEGNSINSGADQLAFRLPLGNELYTGSNSIHPKVTGSWITTSSFASNSTASFNSTPTFVKNTEYFYYDQPIVGIKNAIADKIRVENNVIPEGDVLSPFMSLSQQANISQSYTANTNLLEVAFSPQDEVNDDINSSLGYFNIGEYIGDPRLRSSSAESYPSLNALRDSYFQKYTKNYNLVDFVRLIKFFDNSLFKMIKDFVPARTSLASGIVIKQHILERNKYPQPQVDTNSTIAYYTSGSTKNVPITSQDISVSGTLLPQWNDYNSGTVENFDGGTAGVFEMFNGTSFAPSGSNILNLTQSWSESYNSPLGLVDIIHNSQDEFYNGELKDSNIIITTQSINQPLPRDFTPYNYKQIYYYGTSSIESDIFQSYFFSPQLTPDSGSVLLFSNFISTSSISPNNPTGSITFLKVAKKDSSGINNSEALGQADKLIFPVNYKSTTVNATYNIVPITETDTYYFYQVNSFKYSNNNPSYNPSDYQNEVLDYSFSSSISERGFASSPNYYKISNYTTTTGNTLLNFTASSGEYILNNIPNTPILITASFTPKNEGYNGKSVIKISYEREGSEIDLIDYQFNNTVSSPQEISTSYYGFINDKIYFSISASTTTDPQITSSLITFSVSQKTPVSSSQLQPLIIEPYISFPNFYNSDKNSLLNSVNETRLNTFALDVDYSNGINPVNLNLLLNGSALHAPTPDSNYTSKASTTIKYDGSKSTSRLLNVWSSNDIGTYGKLPTIENLKTMILYSSLITDLSPNLENASVINNTYLIKSNSDIIIPNVTPYSLSEVQQTFLTGEKVSINTKTPLLTENIFKNIIRGGYKVQPILYNQSGSILNEGTFTSSIQLKDNFISGGLSQNYTLVAKPSIISSIPQTYNSSSINTIIVSGSNTTASLSNNSIKYQTYQGLINNKVNLTFTAALDFYNSSSFTYPTSIGVTLTRERSSVQTTIGKEEFVTFTGNNLNQVSPNTHKYLNFSRTITPDEMQSGDQYYLKVYSPQTGYYLATTEIGTYGSFFQVTQSPNPTVSITSSNIWQSASATQTTSINTNTSGSIYKNILFTSASGLVQNYNNPSMYQVDIISSSFNPITNPWSLEYGDEFRFEGREDKVFVVEKTMLSLMGSSQILAIQFTEPLPSTNTDFTQFLIRRFIPDPTQVIIQGQLSSTTTGPYLIKPEFVTNDLNQSIDQVIKDLTQKGLIT